MITDKFGKITKWIQYICVKTKNMWFSKKKTVLDSLKIKDKIYYPSTTGMALIAQVKAISDKDVVVQINGKDHYLQKESVNDHAIILSDNQAKMYITQRLEDPDNNIVYLRLSYIETWIDRLYNLYCRWKKRPVKQVFDREKD